MTYARVSQILVVLLSACGNAPAPAAAPEVAGSMPGMDMSTSGASDAAGIHVSADVASALGIATEPASVSVVELARRAPATVSWDPLQVTRISAQPGGQVRALPLPRPGEAIRKGAVVASLYLPEVRAAFEELRVAATLGEPWLGAARARLLANGIDEGEIDNAVRTGTSPDTYTVRSEVSGIVLERSAAEGAWLGPGGQLGVVGRPDALVVDMVVTGAVPEIGTPVTLRDASTSSIWAAKVVSRLPSADAAGTLVRLASAATPPVGRPLVAEWSDQAAPGGVWVPRTALIDTGARRVVFVATAAGVYEPRTVTVGAHGDGRVQLLEGVEPGEAVVVAGTFLLDSEAQIGSGGHAAHGAH